MVWQLLSEFIMGNRSRRLLKNAQKIVQPVNALETQMKALSDEQLREKTDFFRQELATGKSLDSLLIPAFAVVREGARRVLEMRHFDVQLIGGAILHHGGIAEMKTGEGKTLVGTLACYLNALMGKGVHVVTVNDYLAQRDAEWMGKLYKFLGLSVGVIYSSMPQDQRKEAYQCDITYGTNNEFGFDFLRDGLSSQAEEMVQRGHYFSIVDEIDSVLIDEARTPLIISGALEENIGTYDLADKVVSQIEDAHFHHEEEKRSITFTEAGVDFIEKYLHDNNHLGGNSLYDRENVILFHHLSQSLRAHKMFLRDRDYILRNGQVMIIDEFTGRMMPGRRFSDGLHQALEAKEKVTIQPENQTLASTTFQNYFRLYNKLAGMTGTADTEEREFRESFGLHVVSIPTNRPVVRIDGQDQLFRTSEERSKAVIEEIKKAVERHQPVLVGTTSIEKSEMFAALLKKEKVAHQVLNARHHEQEAVIIAQAGQPGAVTIATNMAGRGTDIQLGGNADFLIQQADIDKLSPEEQQKKIDNIQEKVAQQHQQVLEAGGLYVIGTERHESRRIDNQLRGRSGRQGDPGRTQFFLSLQDDLLRIFGGERLEGLLKKTGLEEGQSLTSGMLSRAILRAQKKVEQRNCETRRHLLKFDDVVNEQRLLIFKWRRRLLGLEDDTQQTADSEQQQELLDSMFCGYLERLVGRFCHEGTIPEHWHYQELQIALQELTDEEWPVAQWIEKDGVTVPSIKKKIVEELQAFCQKRMARIPEEIVLRVSLGIAVRSLDQAWREHLYFLDHISQSINFRSLGQRDPFMEYQKEAMASFDDFHEKWARYYLDRLFRVQIEITGGKPGPDDLDPLQEDIDEQLSLLLDGVDPAGQLEAEAQEEFEPPASRNALCPCGSGRRYKHCHGRIASASRG